MNYGISCDPGSKNASPAVWCRRLKCGACTCNSTGKRHSRSWPESAIQNRPQRRRAADPAQHVPHRRFLVRPAPLCNAGARLAPAHAPHRRAFRPAHRALRQRLRRAFLLGGCSQVMPAVFVPRDGAPGVQSRQNAGRRTRNARSAAVGCNVKPAAAKKGSRSGAACAAPAFSCPSCAALQCRRPACTGSRTAPAGFSSGTPGFTPKTAPRFLAWRVFTSYAGGVRAARWCAGRSVPPKCGAQNAKRATDCGGVQCETGRSEEGQPIRHSAAFRTLRPTFGNPQ